MKHSITPQLSRHPAESMEGNDHRTDHLTFTGKIGFWSARHRWLVIAASIVVMVLAVLSMSSLETKILDYQGEGESAIGAN